MYLLYKEEIKTTTTTILTTRNQLSIAIIKWLPRT